MHRGPVRDTRSQSRSETYSKTCGFHVADQDLEEMLLVAEASRSEIGIPATCVGADFALHRHGSARWPAALQRPKRRKDGQSRSHLEICR